MRFSDFTIENFRGIRELEIRLDRQPTTNVHTLVGLNESGKSTILQAMHWLRQPNAYLPHSLIPKAYRANFNGQISVKAAVVLNDQDEAEIEAALAKHGCQLVEPIRAFTIQRRATYANSSRTALEHLWSFNPIVRKRKGKKTFELPGSDPAWGAAIEYIEEAMLPPVVYYENFLFDIPDRIYLERAGKGLTPEDKVYRAVLQDVLTSLQMGLTIEKHLLERHAEETRAANENIQAVLDDASAQLTDVVIRAWRAIVKNNEQKLEVSLGSGLEVDETGTYVQLKVKEGKSTFYIRERSLGFRWFFGFILFTHFRTYRDNSRRNALFLLDEPASNLHPAAQTKLLSAFNALPNNQLVVYSTHSHHMIKPEWLAGAYVVWNAGHSYEGLDLAYNASMTDVKAQRYFQFVSSRPNDTDLYRPILDALDYSPGPLEMIPDIVIVEGKNDWYTLKYAADVLRLHTGNSPHFYPSTGKDKTDGIVAQYLGWGRRFVVLLDADKGGRDTRERLLRQFGEIVRDRVFTLADVDASWCELEMEDLFEQAERDSITETAFPGERYVKSKFNAAVAALLIRCEEIELSQGTAERLRKLLAFVGQKLGT